MTVARCLAGEHLLPIANVDPTAKLEPNLSKVRDLAPHTGIARPKDS